MLCFSTWITLLILIGSVWSQTPDTEPSGRSLKFGRALMDPVRVRCDASCKKLSRLSFIGNIGCFVNCPELWRLPPTTSPIPTLPMAPIILPAAITPPLTANSITFSPLATGLIPTTTTTPFSPLATGLIPSTTTTPFSPLATGLIPTTTPTPPPSG